MEISKDKVEYKGYIGEFTYDEDGDIFEGSIASIKELVLFQGKSIEALKLDFQEAVNDYIDWCKKRGREPEKPILLP